MRAIRTKTTDGRAPWPCCRSASCLLVPAPAAVAEGQLCADTATVSWQTDVGKLQVTGVFVEVPGCEDGEFVGIELLMDDGGQVPPEEPSVPRWRTRLLSST